MRIPPRAIPIACAAVLLSFGLAMLAGTVRTTDPVSRQPSGDRSVAASLRKITDDLASVLPASRKVLVGKRLLTEPSCLWFPQPGALENQPRRLTLDPNGGPSGRMVTAVVNRHVKSPSEEFTWCQEHLRKLLTKELTASQAVSKRIKPLAAEVASLADALGARDTWPQYLQAAAAAESPDWPTHCLRALNQAVARKDLADARRWARELDAAVFALGDLHRWLEVLMTARLSALDLQAQCKPLFDAMTEFYRLRGKPYNSSESQDRLPGCTGLGPMLENLHEVEHQGERMFRTPESFPAAAARDLAATAPAAVWMPPDLREAFSFLRSILTPENRATWDRAAAAPFDRSYLANILWRMSKVKRIDEVALILRRFDANHPRARQTDLMDVLFYRGELSGGLIWSDRFEPRLMQLAGRMTGDDTHVLRQAHNMTRRFLGGWENYKGHVWTLGQAIDHRKLDCVRGTDMIGTLYRNAGRAGYCSLRLSAGVAGHTIGAAETVPDNPGQMALADPLSVIGPDSTWPDAFFRGYHWPRDYPGNRGPILTAELHARGLDNYVFAAGYIVRGPSAGMLVRAALPYLPGREKTSERKVYAGPYPKMPDVKRSIAHAMGVAER